jgi:hypothetical protein
VLTTRLNRERSGLRSRSAVVAEQEAKTLASGNCNNPGERGASQAVPGEESRGRWGVTRVNTLQTIDTSGQFIYR